jgi:hypothetical protein
MMNGLNGLVSTTHHDQRPFGNIQLSHCLLTGEFRPFELGAAANGENSRAERSHNCGNV